MNKRFDQDVFNEFGGYTSLGMNVTTNLAATGFKLHGQGACTSGAIAGTGGAAWALAPSSGGEDWACSSAKYDAWVQKAWTECKKQAAATTYVSVFGDAGYRCYSGTCGSKAEVRYSSCGGSVTPGVCSSKTWTVAPTVAAQPPKQNTLETKVDALAALAAALTTKVDYLIWTQRLLASDQAGPGPKSACVLAKSSATATNLVP